MSQVRSICCCPAPLTGKGSRLAWLLCGLLFQQLLWAAAFDVSRATTRLVDGSYVLDAHIDYLLSDTALEALDNGVPLTFDVNVEIRRQGAWFWLWEQRPLDLHLRFTIRYHSLAQLYQVVDLNNGTQQNFVTQDAAITALGEIVAVPLLKKKELEPGEHYDVRVKATLDIEALPLPLRPLAYLSPSWNLSSDWRTWPLQP